MLILNSPSFVMPCSLSLLLEPRPQLQNTACQTPTRLGAWRCSGVQLYISLEACGFPQCFQQNAAAVRPAVLRGLHPKIANALTAVAGQLLQLELVYCMAQCSPGEHGNKNMDRLDLTLFWTITVLCGTSACCALALTTPQQNKCSCSPVDADPLEVVIIISAAAAAAATLH